MKLKTIVSALLLLIVMGFFFMGQFYTTLGDTMGSLILTFILTVLLGALMAIATLCRERQGSFSKVLHITGFVIVVVYIIVGTFYVVPRASHFFYVNSSKQDIQAQADTVITRTDQMFAEYKKQAGSRALKLAQDLKNSQLTQQGRTEFQSAYGGLTWNDSLPTAQQNAFRNTLMVEYNRFWDKWNGSGNLRKQFKEMLANDWSAFYSPSNASNLAARVSEYSEKLAENFTKQSPFERLRNEKKTFDTSVNADYIVEKFTGNDTSTAWNIVLFILILFSASAAIFVQSTHVKTQTKKDPIFDTGYEL